MLMEEMAGTQTAGILNSFRGGSSPGPAYTDARSWNGSAWSTIPSTSSKHSFSNLFLEHLLLQLQLVAIMKPLEFKQL